MKSIAFIIPYFGKFPNYYQLWLDTCKYNPSIDFLIYTNDTSQWDYPKNVKVKWMSFETLKTNVESKYNFPISLNAAYKLCDFRPAYGEIFANDLKGYDFWGHCDIDLFWGNIRHFITDDLLDKYKRIYTRGHCSLYKNTPEVNAWYRTLPNHGYQNWVDVFKNHKSCCFDEWGGHCGGGMSHIIEENGISQYNKIDMADLAVNKGAFYMNGIKLMKKIRYIEFKYGRLYAYLEQGKEELLYCHFQKRKLEIDCNVNPDNFFFVAPGSVKNKAKGNSIKEIRYDTFFAFHKVYERIKNLNK